MLFPRTPRLAVLALTLLALLLIGCSTEGEMAADGDQTSTEATASPTAEPTPEPAKTPDSGAQLRAVPTGGKVDCVEGTGPGETTGILASQLLAEGGPAELRGVRAVGSQVEITSAQVVLVRADAPASFNLGALIDDKWPMPLTDPLVEGLDRASRAPLRGFTVPEARSVALLLRLRTDPGAVLKAVEITYAPRKDETAYTAAKMSLTFPDGATCP